MPWTKLKNIILMILVLTNLCLLAFVLGQMFQTSRQEGQAREEAISYLRDRGVQVDEGLIPKSVDLLPQVVERDLAGEERGAAALLGGPVQVEARGGEVYRCFNGSGSIQFHSDGSFSAQLEASAFPLGEDRAAGALALLERLGIQGELLEEEGEALTFRQFWDGVPLFDQQVTLICQGEGAAILSGRRLAGPPAVDTSRRTITIATGLIGFLNGVGALGDVCNQVDGVEPGYSSAASLSGPMTLTPVWRVRTDTGAYQLDLVTGHLSRVS